MQLSGLWRYPVKSLAGEALTVAQFTDDGIRGDRVVHVSHGTGPLTGRTRTGLLTLPAATAPDGRPMISGYPWDSPAALQLVRDQAGPTARLRPYTGPERFDIGNLLVATDGAVERFGHDVRRLRPNLLISGVGPTEEASWPGSALVVGEVLIGIHSVRQRCIVTSIDPDTGEQDLNVFRRIRNEFGNRLALNCWVIRPGTVRLGDPAVLVPTAARPHDLGGWVVGAPYQVDDSP